MPLRTRTRWRSASPATPALLATLVIVAGTLKRAPLDPFLIVLGAFAVAAAGCALIARARPTDKAS